jgi:hypothetical protein
MDFGINLADIHLDFKDELIPQGNYPIQATQIEYRDNKSGLGKHLLITFAVTEGHYAGQKIFQHFNLEHSNQQAKEIALKQLKQLILACGGNGQERLTLALLHGLKGKACTGAVSVQPARNGYGPKNVLRGFNALEKSALLDEELPF